MLQRKVEEGQSAFRSFCSDLAEFAKFLIVPYHLSTISGLDGDMRKKLYQEMVSLFFLFQILVCFFFVCSC